MYVTLNYFKVLLAADDNVLWLSAHSCVVRHKKKTYVTFFSIYTQCEQQHPFLPFLTYSILVKQQSSPKFLPLMPAAHSINIF